MKTLLDPKTLDETIERVNKITPDAPAVFGKLSPHSMLCHLIDSFEIGFGQKGELKINSGFLNSKLGRWFVIDSPIPWPKGKLDAPPEFLETTACDSFDQDREKVLSLLKKFQDGETQSWGISPLLGKLGPQQWGRLQFRHTDHHLQQFGC